MSHIPRDGGIRIPQGATAPKLLQPAAASGAGASIEIDPQPATTTGASGGLVVNVAAPASGTSEAGLVISRAGTPIGFFGQGNGVGAGCQITLSGGTGVSSGITIQGFSNAMTLGAPSSVAIQIANGNYVQCAGNAVLFSKPIQGGATGSPLSLGSSALTVAATGTTTLSAAQQQTPRLVAGTVTLTGAVTIDLGNVIGFFLLNLAAVTVAGQVITLKNGTATQTLTAALTAGPLVVVDCAANAIAAN